MSNNSITSDLNSTFTALNAGQTFTGTAEENGYSHVMVSVHTDKQGILKMELSNDGINWDTVNSYIIDPDVKESKPFILTDKGTRYYRTVYENGSVNQGYMRLKTIYGDNLESTRGNRTEISQFGELLTVQRTPIIELNLTYGTSELRTVQDTQNSGAVNNLTGYVEVETGTTTNSYSQISSAEIGRYIPGYGAEFGIGLTIPTLPTGDGSLLFGAVSPSENNALSFGLDSSGLFVQRITGGVLSDLIYQSSWNIDKLDGTGKSKFNIDVTKGNIYQINYTWYGHGQILFGIVGIDKGSGVLQQKFIPCHSLKVDGISIESPNLRPTVRSDNNSGTQNLKAEVTAMQYSIIGKYIPKFRFVGDFRASVGTSTTLEPLISFRRKSNFDNRSIKIQGYDIIATTEPCIVQLYLNPTLTGASFGTPTDATASETALESDKSATAVSGGVLLWTALVPAGNNIKSSNLANSSLDIDIPNGAIITLTAKTISGTGSILSTFRMREEW